MVPLQGSMLALDRKIFHVDWTLKIIKNKQQAFKAALIVSVWKGKLHARGPTFSTGKKFRRVLTSADIISILINNL